MRFAKQTPNIGLSGEGYFQDDLSPSLTAPSPLETIVSATFQDITNNL